MGVTVRHGDLLPFESVKKFLRDVVPAVSVFQGEEETVPAQVPFTCRVARAGSTVAIGVYLDVARQLLERDRI